MNPIAVAGPLAWDDLCLESTADLEGLLDLALMTPVNSFFTNPGKNFRPMLVDLGYRLSLREEPRRALAPDVSEKITQASGIVEAIHAGALIIDDIEDESEVRRDAPTLHLQFGIPQALNSGNWLYFWGLNQIKKLNLSGEGTMRVLEDCLDLMLKAHYGQAIDIATKIDQIPQEKVSQICFASIELKTGTLLSLALRLGSAIGDSSAETKKALYRLGAKLGVALQMFDDIGNLTQRKSEGPSKRHEDLFLKRPSWIWAQASLLPKPEYDGFLDAVSALPAEEKLDAWLARNAFAALVKKNASAFLAETLREARALWGSTHPETLSVLETFAHKLEISYV